METNRKWRIVILCGFLLIIPLAVWSMGILLKVDSRDISGCATPVSRDEARAVYRVDLPSPPPEERLCLMFESVGNVVRVASGDETLYAYGGDLAGRGRMVGKVYASVFLPEEAWEAPLEIDLEASDSNASLALGRLELCPQSEETRYYIVNQTMGMPLAMILAALALCIPAFLMLGNNVRILREGICFGAMLLCFSALLLGEGGHYLAFTGNQAAWTPVHYLSRYLMPVFLLLYFREVEHAPRQRARLLLAAVGNLAFCAVAGALGLSHAVHFCDLNPAFCAVLAADGIIGVCGLVRNVRARQMSRSRVALLLIALLCLLGMAAERLMPSAWLEALPSPRLDALTMSAIALFYALCYLFAETAHRTHERARMTSRKIETLERTEREALSYKSIAEVLSKNYESVYCVDLDALSYRSYRESDSSSELELMTTGENFYERLAERVRRTVYEEDQEYVLSMLSCEALRAAAENGCRHSFIYRIVVDGKRVYHQMDVVRAAGDDDRSVVLVARDIDAMMRRERALSKERISMLQKEHNHMEAILASAAAYMEVNLTRNLITEMSYDYNGIAQALSIPAPDFGDAVSYDAFMQWWCANVIVDGAEKIAETGSRAALEQGFEGGERRISIYFSGRTPGPELQQGRLSFYLYQDKPTGELLSFCVIYDQTERQRREKEMQALEEKLKMSRIKNFTSQMQPHFLYNALGSIQEIVLDDPGYASELIGDFITHLRSSIRAMANDRPISFEQELENIRAYVNIERMRFSEKLRINYDIRTTDFEVMPLSVQPLVENAIRHGVYNRGTQGGTVTLRSRETPEAWLVEVEDDGVGFDVAALDAQIASGERDSTGLKNLIFRLDKVMGARVDILSEPGVGTRVTITIPKGGTET